MKRLVILMLGLLVIPFLLGLSYSEDPFDEFNKSNLSESPKNSSDQSVSQNSSNDRYVVIDKQFWNGNYSKVITVESFEKSFPPGAFPLHTE